MHNKTNLYRRIAGTFVIFSILIALSVFYFSFSWTTVIVKPKSESFTASQAFSLTDGQTKGPFDIKASAQTEVLDANGQFDVSGTKKVTTKLTGSITLVNDSVTPQPLRSTTRLLSANNVLLRMKDYATVPAHGEVSVAVYADQDGDVGTIDDSHFSVPGLSPSLQEHIYGKTFVQTEAATHDVKVVQKQDIDQAQSSLLTRLQTKFQDDLKSKGIDVSSFQATDATVLSSVASVKEGDEADQFTLTLKARFVAVSFDTQAVYSTTIDTLKGKLAANQELVPPQPGDLKYNVSIDGPALSQMQLKVTAPAKRVTSQDSRLFDAKALTNKSEKDIIEYFKGFDDIDSVQVHMYPFWIVRAPALSDHINILLDTK